MSPDQIDKARQFAAQHRAKDCFIMPNAWDIPSARLLETAGFPSIGTTSAGVAFSLGLTDYSTATGAERIDRRRVLDRIGVIANAVDIPVSADLEAGYGDTATEVGETIRLAIGAGIVGGNLEDFTGNPDAPLFECDEAVERIIAAREAADASGIEFTLNGRTDCFIAKTPNALQAAIERANRYFEAGADCLFVPGVSDAPTIATLAREIDGPLNIVMGLTGCDLTQQQLQDLGVRRISIGGSLARACLALIQQAAKEMAEQGTFTFAENQIGQEHINTLLTHN